MWDRILAGIIENWFLVALSLLMLVGGTAAAYKKFGLKRVLLGKKNDDRELIYRRQDESIEWKETLKTWWIILTGGMSLLTLFLLTMVLVLAFVYAVDMSSTRTNDELLCREFGTTQPSQEQMEDYYASKRGQGIFTITEEITFEK